MIGQDAELKNYCYIFDPEAMHRLGFERVKEDEFDRNQLNKFLDLANLGKYKKKLGKSNIKTKIKILKLKRNSE